VNVMATAQQTIRTAPTPGQQLMVQLIGVN
jgi:hypothetical protein